jgi:methionine synthase I (cobalamin-dependent)
VLERVMRAYIELDGLEDLDTGDPDIFADAHRRLLDDYDIRIVGGCCGTSTARMQAIAARLLAS